MEEKTQDYKFLEMVVLALVNHPEAVKINRIVDEMGVLLTLEVHPSDMPRVIGREGNTAKAIRTLLRIVGMKANARVNLKINEPEGGNIRQSRNDGPGYQNDRFSYGRDRYARSYSGDGDHGYAN